MTRFVATGETLDFLSGAQEPVEVCNPDGRVIGRYTPTPAYRTDVISPISDEEFERRVAEPGGTSLAAFWKKMGRTA